MSEVIQALRGQLEELLSIVSEIDEDELALPSACEGWSISDVLLHLAQTNEMAAASARGQLGGVTGAWLGPDQMVGTDFDDIAGRAVERERGANGADIRARWVRSADDMADALQRCDPARRVQWAVGDLAPRTLATTRIAETWIHTGDVCVGLGVEQPKSDRIWHIARLVHRTLPYSFRRAGEEAIGGVRFAVTSPTDKTVVWHFGDDHAATLISGTAVELCQVAGQRVIAAQTSLRGTGPDSEKVLRLMRTFA